MAGLFTLLFGGFLIGGNILDSARADMETDAAYKCAILNNKETYIDGNRNMRWTSTNEIVQQIWINKSYDIIGVKTGKVYKTFINPGLTKEQEQEERLQKALEYCRQHGIKYLPFYFPNSLSGKKCWDCTGIEVDTGKKYCCYKWGATYYWDNDKLKEKPLYRLVYLEDKPHFLKTEYGKFKEYDAIHDIERLDFDKNHTVEMSYDEKANQKSYSTKIYTLTEEESIERITELKEFPYEYYQLKY